MLRSTVAFIIALAVTLQLQSAGADIGPKFKGAIHPIECGVLPLTGQEETDIVMEAEHVIIDVYHTFIKVDATFWFKGGESDQMDFPLGFPEKWLSGMQYWEQLEDEPDEDYELSVPVADTQMDQRDASAIHLKPGRTVAHLIGGDWGVSEDRHSGSLQAGLVRAGLEVATWEMTVSHPLLLRAFPELFAGDIPYKLLVYPPAKDTQSPVDPKEYRRRQARWNSPQKDKRLVNRCSLQGEQGKGHGKLTGDLAVLPGIDSPPLLEFQAMVNGRPVPVQRERADVVCDSRSGRHQSVWWLLAADFPAGAQVEVRVVYFQPLLLWWTGHKRKWRGVTADTCIGRHGGPPAESTGHFLYWLRSGAFWKGPIGKAVIEVRPHRLGQDFLCCQEQADRVAPDGTMFFEWRDFEPEWGLECTIDASREETARSAGMLAGSKMIPHALRLVNHLVWLYASDVPSKTKHEFPDPGQRLLAFVRRLHDAVDSGDAAARELARAVLYFMLSRLEDDRHDETSSRADMHDLLVPWLWPWSDTLTHEQWVANAHPDVALGSTFGRQNLEDSMVYSYGPLRTLQKVVSGAKLDGAYLSGPGARPMHLLITLTLLGLAILVLAAMAWVFRPGRSSADGSDRAG